MSEELKSREEALGRAFFRGEAEQWREALGPEERTVQELARSSGIEDEDLLQRITGLGIRAETLAAFTLIPLVEVAWADGKMDEQERKAILHGAVSTGIAEGSWSHRLLRIWTDDRPPPELFHLWYDFVRALCAPITCGIL